MDFEGNAIDGPHRAAAGPERSVQIVHDEQWPLVGTGILELECPSALTPGHHRSPWRISNRWRRRSPMRLMDHSSKNMAMAGHSMM